MAEVFHTVNGEKIQRFMARHPAVQDALQREAVAASNRARRLLGKHREQGHARIESVGRGLIDRYVTLSDERGQRAAMSIEYGRRKKRIVNPDGTTRSQGGMKGLFILHRATGLRHKR